LHPETREEIHAYTEKLLILDLLTYEFTIFHCRASDQGTEGRNIIFPPIKCHCLTGIATGLAVMILAVAILTGFKKQIREKIIGFGSNIQIVNYDSKSLLRNSYRSMRVRTSFMRSGISRG
jgi:hypothetical protein